MAQIIIDETGGNSRGPSFNRTSANNAGGESRISTRPLELPTSMSSSRGPRDFLEDVSLQNIVESTFAKSVSAVDSPCQKLAASDDNVPDDTSPGGDEHRHHRPASNPSMTSCLATTGTIDASEEELFGAFSNFCEQGTPGNTQRVIGSEMFGKVCRDCKILDDAITSTVVQIVFQQVVTPGKKQIDYSQFRQGMKIIAERKGLEATELYNQIIETKEAVSLEETEKKPGWWNLEILKASPGRLLKVMTEGLMEEEEKEEMEKEEHEAESYEALHEFSMDAVRKTYFAYCVQGMSTSSASAMADDLREHGRFCGGIMIEVRGKGLMDSKSFEKICGDHQFLGRGVTPGIAASIFMQVKDDKMDKHICFKQFQEALGIIARRRGVPVNGFLQALARSKGPEVEGETAVDIQMKSFSPGKDGGPRFAQPLARSQEGSPKAQSLYSSLPARPHSSALERRLPNGLGFGSSFYRTSISPSRTPSSRGSSRTPSRDPSFSNISNGATPLPVRTALGSPQSTLEAPSIPRNDAFPRGRTGRALRPSMSTSNLALPSHPANQRSLSGRSSLSSGGGGGSSGVKATFLAYCSRPTDQPHHQQQMTGAEFAKLCRDCSLFDAGFTAGMADNIFCKVKKQGQRKIGYNQFMAALIRLAEEKGVDSPDEILNTVAEQREPTLVATKPEPVRFYDDKSLYTGMHAETHGIEPEAAGHRAHRSHSVILRPLTSRVAGRNARMSSASSRRPPPRAASFGV